jgi:hypothetical protein
VAIATMLFTARRVHLSITRSSTCALRIPQRFRRRQRAGHDGLGRNLAGIYRIDQPRHEQATEHRPLRPSGGGKGTQSAFLIERYKLIHLSTVDLLRAEKEAETPLGLQAQELMSKGLWWPTRS